MGRSSPSPHPADDVAHQGSAIARSVFCANDPRVTIVVAGIDRFASFDGFTATSADREPSRGEGLDLSATAPEANRVVLTAPHPLELALPRGHRLILPPRSAAIRRKFSRPKFIRRDLHPSASNRGDTRNGVGDGRVVILKNGEVIYRPITKSLNHAVCSALQASSILLHVVKVADERVPLETHSLLGLDAAMRLEGSRWASADVEDAYLGSLSHMRSARLSGRVVGMGIPGRDGARRACVGWDHARAARRRSRPTGVPRAALRSGPGSARYAFRSANMPLSKASPPYAHARWRSPLSLGFSIAGQ